MELKRVERTWKEFFQDPVFGRVWWDNVNGERVYTRGVVYIYPHEPEWVIYLASLHDQSHLDGCPGQSYPLDIMFEAPGKLADTWAEKVLTIFVAPVIVGRRIFTGSWFSKENQARIAAKNE